MKAKAPPGRSPQCIYAESLSHCRHQYGYPLLSPSPSSSLGKSYQEEGLKIGDVGYVNPDGTFYVCCNICCKPDAKINSRVAPGFQNIELEDTLDIEMKEHAITAPAVIKSSHIFQDDRDCDNPSAPRVFRPKASPSLGAILILPSDAYFENLQYHAMEKFREIAEKCGREWCMMSPFKSVILITGLYKVRSWSLGYYHDPPEKITAIPQSNLLPLEKYLWDATNGNIFPAGHSKPEGSKPNQTIFLRGFRVTTKDTPVEKDRSCLSLLWAFVDYLCRNKTGSVEVRHEPMLIRPFDFVDEAHRRLLEKIPTAEIAITHDDEWMHMLDQGDQSCEVLVQVDRVVGKLQNLGVVLMDGNGVISLQNKLSYPSPERPVLLPTTTVIKSLRVGNVLSGLKRMPFGFYIQLNNVERRTTTKFAPVSSPVIEWIEELPLSGTSEKIQLSLCVMFGSDPLLGGRAVLHTVEVGVQGLADKTHHIFDLSPGELGSSAPQVFLTLGERRINYLNVRSEHNFNRSSKEPHPVTDSTDSGHDALLRYYQNYKSEDISEAVEHFERALSHFSRQDHGYTTAVSNLATAHLNRHLLDGTYCDIYSSVISPYREVLDLLPPGHVDIPATSLYLAQALLYRYGRQGCAELPDLKIEELMDTIKRLCPVDSHAQQARNLVLQTYKRLKYVRSRNFDDLDKLLEELNVAVRDCPEGYFDKPHRLINFGIALRIRSQHHANLGDLSYVDESVMAHEEAIRLIPPRHPDKTTFLISLSMSLLTRFEQRGDSGSRDLSDLNRSIEIIAEAERLVPKGHVERAACLNAFAVALLQRFAQNTDPITDLSDLDYSIQFSDEASRLISKTHPDRVSHLHSLSIALLRRFDLSSDLTDLGRHITVLEEILQLISSARPDKVSHLHSLSIALLRRFDLFSDSTDLDCHITVLEEILQLISSEGTDRILYLDSLAAALLKRFDARCDPSDFTDLDRHIAMLEEALHLTPSSHPDKATYSNSLRIALQRRPPPTQLQQLRSSSPPLSAPHVDPVKSQPHPTRLPQPTLSSSAPHVRRVEPQPLPKQPQQSRPSPSSPSSSAPHIRHVVFIGETGTGKSSIINLIVGRDHAPVSPDVKPCTTRVDHYDVVVKGRTYRLWDTPGLQEPVGLGERLLGRSLATYSSLRQSLRERKQARELDLVVFCVRASRAISGMVKAYQTSCRASRQAAIPVVLAVTHLEREQPTMDAWWQRNERMLAGLGLLFDGHACLTCDPKHNRRWTSWEEILVLISADYRLVGSSGQDYLPDEDCVVC